MDGDRTNCWQDSNRNRSNHGHQEEFGGQEFGTDRGRDRRQENKQGLSANSGGSVWFDVSFDAMGRRQREQRCDSRPIVPVPQAPFGRGNSRSNTCLPNIEIVSHRGGALNIDVDIDGGIFVDIDIFGRVQQRPGRWRQPECRPRPEPPCPAKPEKPHCPAEPPRPRPEPPCSPPRPEPPRLRPEPPCNPPRPEPPYCPPEPYCPPGDNYSEQLWLELRGRGLITDGGGNSFGYGYDFEVSTSCFPPRHPSAMTGSEFFERVLAANASDPRCAGMTGQQREQAILSEIESGNIPDFLRHPKTITVNDGCGNTAQLSVLPDYLAIGSNDDYVRVPMTPLLARAIADRYGFELPTRKVVKDIYMNSDMRLSGVGLVQNQNDTCYMQGNGFFLKHDQIIDGQLGGCPPGALIAGHKKDLIVSRFAAQHPDRLDFYGLFDGRGRAIQGAGGGPHDVNYVDYSHGVRFISQDVIVNGRSMKYADVLNDPNLCRLLSDEGPVNTRTVYRQ